MTKHFPKLKVGDRAFYEGLAVTQIAFHEGSQDGDGVAVPHVRIIFEREDGKPDLHTATKDEIFNLRQRKGCLFTGRRMTSTVMRMKKAVRPHIGRLTHRQ